MSLPSVEASGWRPLLGVDVAVVVCGMLGLAVCLYELAQPHNLGGFTAYDDGVYFGAAVRLVHGVVPYRDFVLVHPPGLPLLLTPIAALTRVTGTRDGLEVARVLTSIVSGLNAALAGLVVRKRGPVAVLAAGLTVACYALQVEATQTLLLEPWFVFCCLLGVVLVLPDAELSSGRRLWLGGCLLGFAIAVKVWALFPVLALIGVCRVVRRSRQSWQLLGSIAAGFAVPCVPFFALAPKSFVHDVVLDQTGRGALPVDRWPVAERMLAIAGLTTHGSGFAISSAGVWLVFGLLAVAVATLSVRFDSLTRLDWFVFAAAVLAVVSVLVAPEFYAYYGYFPHVFLAILFGLVAGSAASGLTMLADRRRPGGVAFRVAGPALVATVVVVLSAISLRAELRSTREYLSGAVDPGAAVRAAIPTGACVIADEPTLTLISNRFVTSRSGCPDVVDSYGSWLATANGDHAPTVPPYPASLVTRWISWLRAADYTVLSAPRSNFLPWAPQLAAYFDTNYNLIYAGPHAYVYRRTAGD